MGNAWAMGGTRGGAGASWRSGAPLSSSKSPPKRSASLMKELGQLRLYPRLFPVGHDGYAHVEPWLDAEVESRE
jgi:hypothetical protein